MDTDPGIIYRRVVHHGTEREYISAILDEFAKKLLKDDCSFYLNQNLNKQNWTDKKNKKYSTVDITNFCLG